MKPVSLTRGVGTSSLPILRFMEVERLSYYTRRFHLCEVPDLLVPYVVIVGVLSLDGLAQVIGFIFSDS